MACALVWNINKSETKRETLYSISFSSMVAPPIFALIYLTNVRFLSISMENLFPYRTINCRTGKWRVCSSAHGADLGLGTIFKPSKDLSGVIRHWGSLQSHTAYLLQAVHSLQTTDWNHPEQKRRRWEQKRPRRWHCSVLEGRTDQRSESSPGESRLWGEGLRSQR